MAKIFVAVPTFDHKIWTGWLNSFINMGQSFADRGHTIWLECWGGTYVYLARNVLVEMFWQSDCDSMLFIDADEGWEAEGAARLVESPHEVIAGVYPVKIDSVNEEGKTEIVFNIRGKYEQVDGNIYEGGGVPGGFLRISRSAVAKMKEAYPIMASLEGRRFNLFFDPMVTKGFNYLGEDYAFCERWIQIGGKCYIDSDITFQHFGTKTWTGNLAQSSKVGMRFF
jgi:hypothetical protein